MWFTFHFLSRQLALECDNTYTLNSLLTPWQRSYGTNKVVHSTNKIDRIMNKLVRKDLSV